MKTKNALISSGVCTSNSIFYQKNNENIESALRKQSSKDLSSIPTNPKPKQNNKKKLQLYGFFVP
jgi:hypothetical protein